MDEKKKFRKNLEKQILQGYFWVDGAVFRRKIASFSECGFDSKGNQTIKSERELKRIAKENHRRYDEILAKLNAKAGKKVKPHDTPIDKAFDQWIESSAGLRKEATITKFYQPTKKKYLAAVGKHSMTDFGFKEVAAFRAWLVTKGGLSTTSANSYLRTLHTFCQWSVDSGLIEKIPKFEFFASVSKLPEIYSDEELRRLLETLRGKQETARNGDHRQAYKMHERFIILAISTGMRLSEITNLEWWQFDLELGRVAIRTKADFTIKEKQDKIRPILPFAIPFLKKERLENPGEVFFLDDGKGGQRYKEPHALSTALSRLKKQAGVNLRVKAAHGFRALFASLAEESGVDPFTIQELLGHSDIKVTKVYLGRPSQRIEAAIEVIDNRAKTIGI